MGCFFKSVKPVSLIAIVIALAVASCAENSFLVRDTSRTTSTKSVFSGGAHGSMQTVISDPGGGWYGRNFKKPAGANASNMVVVLPKDRCKAGKIFFGNGKSCPALGRGRTVWNEEAAIRKFRPGNYTKGKTSSKLNGGDCYYLNSNKKMGATPVTTFTIDGLGGKKSHWDQTSISITEKIVGRSDFAIHSDKFYSKFPSPEARAHSSHGCIKVSNECQTELKKYYKVGMKVHVVEQ